MPRLAVFLAAFFVAFALPAFFTAFLGGRLIAFLIAISILPAVSRINSRILGTILGQRRQFFSPISRNILTPNAPLPAFVPRYFETRFRGVFYGVLVEVGEKNMRRGNRL
jgi:hypothetical protein